MAACGAEVEASGFMLLFSAVKSLPLERIIHLIYGAILFDRTSDDHRA